MAKKSVVERDKKRRRMVKSAAAKRSRLKLIAADSKLPMEERFAARLKLAQMPRNSAPSRVHNRCLVTGRPRGYYRKLSMSRIALREMTVQGLIPGMVKSSW